MDVADATRFPQDVGRVDPGPEELPDNREPPFPTLCAIGTYISSSAFDGVVKDSISRMELL